MHKQQNQYKCEAKYFPILRVGKLRRVGGAGLPKLESPVNNKMFSHLTLRTDESYI